MKFEFKEPSFVKRKRVDGNINEVLDVKQKTFDNHASEARRKAEELFVKKDTSGPEKNELKKPEEKRVSQTIIRRKVA